METQLFRERGREPGLINKSEMQGWVCVFISPIFPELLGGKRKEKKRPKRKILVWVTASLGEKEPPLPPCPGLEENGRKARFLAALKGIGWEVTMISSLCTCFSPAGLGGFYSERPRLGPLQLMGVVSWISVGPVRGCKSSGEGGFKKSLQARVESHAT